MPDDIIILKLPRSQVERMLGQAMSDISEYCHCARWLSTLEVELIPILETIRATGQPQEWGIGTIPVEDASYAMALHDALGYWVTPLYEPPYGYVPYQRP